MDKVKVLRPVLLLELEGDRSWSDLDLTAATRALVHESQ